MKSRYRQFPITIRIVSLILIVTFLAQDIVWAHPDKLISNPAKESKLAPNTFFSLKDSKERGGALFIEYLIENNKLFHSNISLIAVQHLLEHKDIKAWFTNNKIAFELDYTHDGQLGSIRINTPAGYTLRYYDPVLKLKNPFVCDPQGVTNSKELNPRLHKQIIKSRTLPVPRIKSSVSNSANTHTSGVSPDAAFGKGVALRHNRVNIVVEIFPKKLLKMGEHYERMPWEDRLEVDAKCENAQKIDEAIMLLEERSSRVRLETAERGERMKKNMTVVEIDLPSTFLIYGHDVKGDIYWQITHIGKSQGRVYIPKKFLDNLDINSAVDMECLATILNHDEFEIERFWALNLGRKGITFEDIEGAHEEAMRSDPFNRYDDIEMRLGTIYEPTDQVIRKELPGLRQEIRRIHLMSRSIGRSKSPLSAAVALFDVELGKLYIKLGCYYDIIEDRKNAIRYYGRAVGNLKKVSHKDSGLLPIAAQERIIYLYARERMMPDLLREIDKLTSYDAFRSDSLRYIPEEDRRSERNFFNDVMSSWRFQRVKNQVIYMLDHHINNEDNAAEKDSLLAAKKRIEDMNYMPAPEASTRVGAAIKRFNENEDGSFEVRYRGLKILWDAVKKLVNAIRKYRKILIGITIVSAVALTLYTNNPIHMLVIFGMAAEFASRRPDVYEYVFRLGKWEGIPNVAVPASIKRDDGQTDIIHDARLTVKIYRSNNETFRVALSLAALLRRSIDYAMPEAVDSLDKALSAAAAGLTVKTREYFDANYSISPDKEVADRFVTAIQNNVENSIASARMEYDKSHNVPRFGKIHDEALRRDGYRYFMASYRKSGKPPLSKFEYRWNMFESLDDQVMGNIEEREWVIQTMQEVTAIQKTYAGVMGIKENIPDDRRREIEEKLKDIKAPVEGHGIKIPAKQMAAGYIAAALGSFRSGELEDMRESYRNLNLTIQMLGKRKRDVENIYHALRRKMQMLTAWTLEMNNYMASLTAINGTDRLYGLANRDEIKAPGNEPEFEGIEPLAREALRLIEGRDEGDREEIKALLSRMKEEIQSASIVQKFMRDYRDIYYETRYAAVSGSGQPLSKEEVFRNIWLKYSSRGGLTLGPPEYWYARFYQAAFIHHTILNPEKRSERMLNPTFRAATFLISLLKIGEINSILNTRSLLAKDKFAGTRTLLEGFLEKKRKAGNSKPTVYDLSVSDRKSLIRSIANSLELDNKGRAVLNRCAAHFLGLPDKDKNAAGPVMPGSILGKALWASLIVSPVFEEALRTGFFGAGNWFAFFTVSLILIAAHFNPLNIAQYKEIYEKDHDNEEPTLSDTILSIIAIPTALMLGLAIFAWLCPDCRSFSLFIVYVIGHLIGNIYTMAWNAGFPKHPLMPANLVPDSPRHTAPDTNRQNAVLVFNCGSSSVKYKVYNMDDESIVAEGSIERIKEPGQCANHTEAIKTILKLLKDKYSIEPVAIGHRVVHGGDLSESVLIDDKVKAEIKRCIKYAPEHNPHNLAGILACEELLPGVPQVAVFDTAFHSSIPEENRIYAIPRAMSERYKIRRTGFHGISYSYVLPELARQLNKRSEEINAIIAHLGNGCSMVEVKDGKAVNTTMGFTPLEGLIMGTRSGTIPADIIIHLLKELAKTIPAGTTINALLDRVELMLNQESGLLGLSGLSKDVRDLLKAREEGHPGAKLALDLFVKSVVRHICMYYGELDGKVDAIVFTAGIGENAIELRQDIIAKLPPYIRDTVQFKDIRTNEELMIARETMDVMRREMQFVKLPEVTEAIGDKKTIAIGPDEREMLIVGPNTYEESPPILDIERHYDPAVIDKFAWAIAETSSRAIDEFKKRFPGRVPKIAFLSYVSYAGEKEESVFTYMMNKACEHVRSAHPDIAIVGKGSVQFDVIMPSVRAKKLGETDTSVPNILVCPSYHTYRVLCDVLSSLPSVMNKDGIEPKTSPLDEKYEDPPLIILPDTITFKDGSLQEDVIQAAIEAANGKIAKIILTTDDPKALCDSLNGRGARFLELSCENSAGEDKPEKMASMVRAIRDASKKANMIVWDVRQAENITKARPDPEAKSDFEKRLSTNLLVSSRLVKNGGADGLVAAVELPSKLFVKAMAASLLKKTKNLYDYFIMTLPRSDYGAGGSILYVGTAYREDPSSSDLAEMAIAGAGKFESTFGQKSKVCLVTTKRSPLVKVEDALKKLKTMAGDLDVAASSFDEGIKGRCNVFVFHNLPTGNIVYKATERLFGALATGPLSMETERPTSDLSRGAKKDAIENTIRAVASQAVSARKEASAISDTKTFPDDIDREAAGPAGRFATGMPKRHNNLLKTREFILGFRASFAGIKAEVGFDPNKPLSEPLMERVMKWHDDTRVAIYTSMNRYFDAVQSSGQKLSQDELDNFAVALIDAYRWLMDISALYENQKEGGSIMAHGDDMDIAEKLAGSLQPVFTVRNNLALRFFDALSRTNSIYAQKFFLEEAAVITPATDEVFRDYLFGSLVFMGRDMTEPFVPFFIHEAETVPPGKLSAKYALEGLMSHADEPKVLKFLFAYAGKHLLEDLVGLTDFLTNYANPSEIPKSFADKIMYYAGADRSEIDNVGAFHSDDQRDSFLERMRDLYAKIRLFLIVAVMAGAASLYFYTNNPMFLAAVIFGMAFHDENWGDYDEFESMSERDTGKGRADKKLDLDEEIVQALKEMFRSNPGLVKKAMDGKLQMEGEALHSEVKKYMIGIPIFELIARLSRRLGDVCPIATFERAGKNVYYVVFDRGSLAKILGRIPSYVKGSNGQDHAKAIPDEEKNGRRATNDFMQGQAISEKELNRILPELERLLKKEGYIKMWGAFSPELKARIETYKWEGYEKKIDAIKKRFIYTKALENNRWLFDLAIKLDTNKKYEDVRMLGYIADAMGLNISDEMSKIFIRAVDVIRFTDYFRLTYGIDPPSGVYCESNDDADKLLIKMVLYSAGKVRTHLPGIIEQYTDIPAKKPVSHANVNIKRSSRQDHKFDQHTMAANILTRLMDIKLNWLAKALLRLEKISQREDDRYKGLLSRFWNTEIGQNIMLYSEIKPYYAGAVAEGEEDPSDEEIAVRVAKKKRTAELKKIRDAKNQASRLPETGLSLMGYRRHEEGPAGIAGLILRILMPGLWLSFARPGRAREIPETLIVSHERRLADARRKLDEYMIQYNSETRSLAHFRPGRLLLEDAKRALRGTPSDENIGIASRTLERFLHGRWYDTEAHLNNRVNSLGALEPDSYSDILRVRALVAASSHKVLIEEMRRIASDYKSLHLLDPDSRAAGEFYAKLMNFGTFYDKSDTKSIDAAYIKLSEIRDMFTRESHDRPVYRAAESAFLEDLTLRLDVLNDYISQQKIGPSQEPQKDDRASEAEASVHYPTILRPYSDLKATEKADPKMRALIEKYGYRFFGDVHLEEMSTIMPQWDEGMATIAFVSYYNGEPIGIFDYAIFDDVAESGGLYVDELMRRHGAGYELLNRAVEDAKDRGLRIFNLHPIEEEASQAVHGKFIREHKNAVKITERDVTGLPSTITVDLRAPAEPIPVNNEGSPATYKECKILVLCNQNKERSPLAAHIMQENIPEDLDGRVSIKSAAIYDIMTDPAVEGYTSRDPVLRDHRPTLATREDLLKADIIFVMTNKQKKYLESIHPEIIGKVCLILEGRDLNTTTLDHPDSFMAHPYQGLRRTINDNLDAIFSRIRKISTESKTAPDTNTAPIGPLSAGSSFSITNVDCKLRNGFHITPSDHLASCIWNRTYADTGIRVYISKAGKNNYGSVRGSEDAVISAKRKGTPYNLLDLHLQKMLEILECPPEIYDKSGEPDLISIIKRYYKKQILSQGITPKGEKGSNYDILVEGAYPIEKLLEVAEYVRDFSHEELLLESDGQEQNEQLYNEIDLKYKERWSAITEMIAAQPMPDTKTRPDDDRVSLNRTSAETATPGAGVSEAGVLPHRGAGNVNDCIVNILGTHLNEIINIAMEKHKLAPSDLEKIQRFKKWFMEERRPGDNVPAERMLPIESFASGSVKVNAWKREKTLLIVELPVSKLGNINGQAFTAHLGFTTGYGDKGIIWVAAGTEKSPRNKFDIELDVVHEEKECLIALRELGSRMNDKKFVGLRDSPSFAWLRYFSITHVRAWQKVVHVYREEYRRYLSILSYNTNPILEKRRRRNIGITHEKFKRALRRLEEAERTMDFVIPSWFGIGVVSSSEENSQSSAAAMQPKGNRVSINRTSAETEEGLNIVQAIRKKEWSVDQIAYCINTGDDYMLARYRYATEEYDDEKLLEPDEVAFILAKLYIDEPEHKDRCMAIAIATGQEVLDDFNRLIGMSYWPADVRKCYDDFKGLIRERLSGITSGKITPELLATSLNGDTTAMFAKMQELRQRVVIPVSQAYDPQGDMCFYVSYAFSEVFNELFRNKYRSVVRQGVYEIKSKTPPDVTVGETTHYVPIIGRSIAVDMTYGQFNSGYSSKVLVTTIDKLQDFGLRRFFVDAKPIMLQAKSAAPDTKAQQDKIDRDAAGQSGRFATGKPEDESVPVSNVEASKKKSLTDLSSFGEGSLVVHEKYGLIKIIEIGADEIRVQIIGSSRYITCPKMDEAEIYASGTAEADSLTIRRANTICGDKEFVALQFGCRALFDRRDLKYYKRLIDEHLRVRDVREIESKFIPFLLSGKGRASDLGHLADDLKRVFLIILKDTGEDIIKTAILKSFMSQEARGNKQSAWPALIGGSTMGSPVVTKLLDKYFGIPYDVDHYYRNLLWKYGIKTLISEKDYEDAHGGIVTLADYYPPSDERHNADMFSKTIDRLREDHSLADAVVSICAPDIEKRVSMESVDLIVPVPAFVQSKNRTVALAESIGRKFSKKVEPEKGLILNDTIDKQVNRRNRWSKFINVAGKFVGSRKIVQGKTVLIVDDFSDTGATLIEAQRAVMEAGAKRTIILAFGKTVEPATVEPAKEKDKPHPALDTLLRQQTETAEGSLLRSSSFEGQVVGQASPPDRIDRGAAGPSGRFATGKPKSEPTAKISDEKVPQPGNPNQVTIDDSVANSIQAVVDHYKKYGEPLRQTAGAVIFDRSPEDIVDLFRKIGLGKGMTVLDCGSGDGFVLALAQAFGANAIGYEQDKYLFNKSRGHIESLAGKGVVDRGSIELHQGDYRFAGEVGRADIIYMFGAYPFDNSSIRAYMMPFEDNLLRNMKPGSRFFIRTALGGILLKLQRDDSTYIPFSLFTKKDRLAASPAPQTPNFIINTYVVDARTRKNIKAVIRKEGADKIILETDEIVRGSFYYSIGDCHIGAEPAYKSLAVKDITVSEEDQHAAGDKRMLLYVGWRLMQAAAILSRRSNECLGAIDLRSDKENTGSQEFYHTMKGLGLTNYPVWTYVDWYLSAKDAARFIEGIETLIEVSQSGIPATQSQTPQQLVQDTKTQPDEIDRTAAGQSGRFATGKPGGDMASQNNTSTETAITPAAAVEPLTDQSIREAAKLIGLGEVPTHSRDARGAWALAAIRNVLDIGSLKEKKIFEIGGTGYPYLRNYIKHHLKGSSLIWNIDARDDADAKVLTIKSDYRDFLSQMKNKPDDKKPGFIFSIKGVPAVFSSDIGRSKWKAICDSLSIGGVAVIQPFGQMSIFDNDPAALGEFAKLIAQFGVTLEKVYLVPYPSVEDRRIFVLRKTPNRISYDVMPISADLLMRLPAMAIGEGIAAIREERGLTMTRVRIAAGIASSTYTHIEQSNSLPRPRHLYEISKALAVDPVLIIKHRPWDTIAPHLKSGQKIFLLRLSKGWTQEDFASELEKEGLVFNSATLEAKGKTVLQWEHGAIPGKDKQAIIEKVLGYSGIFEELITAAPDTKSLPDKDARDAAGSSGRFATGKPESEKGKPATALADLFVIELPRMTEQYYAVGAKHLKLGESNLLYSVSAALRYWFRERAGLEIRNMAIKNVLNKTGDGRIYIKISDGSEIFLAEKTAKGFKWMLKDEGEIRQLINILLPATAAPDTKSLPDKDARDAAGSSGRFATGKPEDNRVFQKGTPAETIISDMEATRLLAISKEIDDLGEYFCSNETMRQGKKQHLSDAPKLAFGYEHGLISTAFLLRLSCQGKCIMDRQMAENIVRDFDLAIERTEYFIASLKANRKIEESSSLSVNDPIKRLACDVTAGAIKASANGSLKKEQIAELAWTKERLVELRNKLAQALSLSMFNSAEIKNIGKKAPQPGNPNQVRIDDCEKWIKDAATGSIDSNEYGTAVLELTRLVDSIKTEKGPAGIETLHRIIAGLPRDRMIRYQALKKLRELKSAPAASQQPAPDTKTSPDRIAKDAAGTSGRFATGKPRIDKVSPSRAPVNTEAVAKTITLDDVIIRVMAKDRNFLERMLVSSKKIAREIADEILKTGPDEQSILKEELRARVKAASQKLPKDQNDLDDIILRAFTYVKHFSRRAFGAKLAGAAISLQLGAAEKALSVFIPAPAAAKYFTNNLSDALWAQGDYAQALECEAWWQSTRITDNFISGNVPEIQNILSARVEARLDKAAFEVNAGLSDIQFSFYRIEPEEPNPFGWNMKKEEFDRMVQKRVDEMRYLWEGNPQNIRSSFVSLFSDTSLARVIRTIKYYKEHGQLDKALKWEKRLRQLEAGFAPHRVFDHTWLQMRRDLEEREGITLPKPDIIPDNFKWAFEEPKIDPATKINDEKTPQPGNPNQVTIDEPVQEKMAISNVEAIEPSKPIVPSNIPLVAEPYTTPAQAGLTDEIASSAVGMQQPPRNDVVIDGNAIDLLDKLFKDVRVPSDSKVLLSENLFIVDGNRLELDNAKLALKPLLDNGAIAILNSEDIKRRATNGRISKDKVTVVLSAEEFNDESIWKDSDKETRLKASILVLGDKLTGANYLYLQGVIGLARAIMANNKQAVSYYYRILSGDTIDESVLKLLDNSMENNIAFAIKAILRFKDPGRMDPDELRTNIIKMETLLIAA